MVAPDPLEYWVCGETLAGNQWFPVSGYDFSLPSQRYTTPARMAPAIGATQNSQSCCSAQPPTTSAGPVLRAGFTEVLVTGMLTRWISVRPRPMAIGAKPLGAWGCVAPQMMTRKKKVITISQISAAFMPYLPGEWSPKPLAAKPP